MKRAFSLLLIVPAVLHGAANAVEPARPNIVFLLADDLGWGDLGCQGHPYARTPHLDRLAKEGTRFQQFYVSGVTCCPSRTGFMTSRHCAGYPVYPAGGGFAGRTTVTELLKQAGYATGHFGKWHIGPETKPGTYGIHATPESEAAEKRAAKRDPARREIGRDAHIYDDAIRFIEAHRDRPFYVNVWGHITHHPVNPPASLADRFLDVRFDESAFRPAMQEKFATVRAHRGDVDQAMRNYLGDVSSLDDAVGRLLVKLDELGLRENTIVVFSSDHGSPAIRPEVDADGTNVDRADDSKESLRLNLMGYNGGLRGGKHNAYEGGVRVPFLIRWPSRVPGGRVDTQSVTSGLDWLPTIASIVGATGVPADLDGEDVSKAWLGGTHVRTKPLYWKTSNPNSEIALRDANWKLHIPGRRGGAVELFDVLADPEETKNLAAERPEIVKSMRSKIKAWDATLPRAYEKTKEKQD
jgi:N-acetylgalactosamine-6-sulfatase